MTELKSLLLNALKRVPGVLSEPSPQILVVDLGDQESHTLKLRVLWWTKAARQHQMLESYDSVLSALRETLRSATGQDAKRDRVA